MRYWNGYVWTQHLARPARFAPSPFARPAAKQPAARPAPGVPGLGIAVIGFGVAVGLSLLILWLLSRAGNPGGVAARLGLSEIGLWVGMIGAVVVASKRNGTGKLSVDFGWTVRKVDIGIGVLGAIAARSMAYLASIPLLPVYEQLQRQPQVGLSPSRITGATGVVFGLVVCVGAPIVEELFFRGLIQTRLVGLLGAGWGIAVTSVLFGAAHLIGWQNVASLLAAAIIAASGSVLGFLRYRTGRLGTSTIAHSVFNGMVFALLLATNT